MPDIGAWPASQELKCTRCGQVGLAMYALRQQTAIDIDIDAGRLQCDKAECEGVVRRAGYFALPKIEAVSK